MTIEARFCQSLTIIVLRGVWKLCQDSLSFPVRSEFFQVAFRNKVASCLLVLQLAMTGEESNTAVEKRKTLGRSLRNGRLVDLAPRTPP